MAETNALHIIHFVASMKGGAAQHVVQLSEWLAANGHRADVVSNDDNPALVASLKSKRIGFHSFDFSNAFSLSTVMALRAFLSKTKCTHHHLHGHRAAAVVRLASMGISKTVPMAYTVHGYHPTHYQSTLSKAFANGLERYMERRVDAFICVSNSTKQELIRSVPTIEKRCVVVPNGIPIVEYRAEEKAKLRQQTRETYGFAPEHLVLGTIARLQWQKSVHRLLQAFSLIVAAHPEVHLALCGSGPEQKKLEEMARELRVGQNLKLLGEVDDTHPVYCMMDLFVLPSLWEGLPLTVLEAWSHEVPVIVTDVSGSRDLIEDGVTGFVATNTATGLAQAVDRARKKSADYPTILKNAKERLLNEHTVERMAERTLKVYASVEKNAG